MTTIHAVHPRAPRFELEVPVRFRGVGESVWSRGRTVNASRTGVLVRSHDTRLGLRDSVEFVLALPPVEGAQAGVEVQCTGAVVRFKDGGGVDDGGERVLALTIDDEQFGRSERERLTAHPRAGQIDA
jgi:hypothetical protein